MTSQEETDAIWQAMPGAAPLKKAFGYWPTLHDARVYAMEIEFEAKALSVTLDYTDLISEKDNAPELSLRITLRWSAIAEAKLRIEEGDLYGVSFAQVGGLIETRFDEYSWGLDGYIRAGSLAVTKIESAPDMSRLLPSDPVSSAFTIGMK